MQRDGVEAFLRLSEAGFDAHLVKPVDTDQLRMILAGQATPGSVLT